MTSTTIHPTKAPIWSSAVLTIETTEGAYELAIGGSRTTLTLPDGDRLEASAALYSPEAGRWLSLIQVWSLACAEQYDEADERMRPLVGEFTAFSLLGGLGGKPLKTAPVTALHWKRF